MPTPFSDGLEADGRVLIAVAKRPAPGESKTRLSPPLTLEQAAQLYESFLLDTLDLMRQVARVQRVIAFSPESEQDYFQRLAPDFGLLLQQGSDLGARLDNASQHYLARGNRSVVIIDSDSPSLPALYVSNAFEMLEGGTDVVLGPCDDGGYYLIGLTRPAPSLLRGVRMSTPTVLQDTLALSALQGLRAEILPTWFDIDDRDSLERLSYELAGPRAESARHTRACLADLARQGFPEARPAQGIPRRSQEP